MQQTRSYFDDRLLTLPFWYRVAVQLGLLPDGCLDDLASTDAEVQWHCTQKHRGTFFLCAKTTLRIGTHANF